MVRITELKCRGLYSYRDPLKIVVPKKAVIVGPNNSGKSNVFRLIRLFADTLSSSSELKDHRISKEHNVIGNRPLSAGVLNHQISKGVDDPYLELSIELSENETNRIIDFISFYGQRDENEIFECENRNNLVVLFNKIRIRIMWEKTAMHGIKTSAESEFEKIGLKIYGEKKYQVRMSSTSEAADTKDHEPPLMMHKLLDELSGGANAKKSAAEFFSGREMIIRSTLEKGQKAKYAERMLADLRSYLRLSGARSDIGFFELVGKILAKGTIHTIDGRHIDVSHVWTAESPNSTRS